MDAWTTLLLLAALPALGNALGALLAEWREVTPRQVNLALHAAAGIVVAVVAVELLPRVRGELPGWLLAAGIGAGGVLYLLLEAAVGVLRAPRGERTARAGPWMVYAAVVVDLASDGLLIGAGVAVSPQLGLVLAVGQVLADLPEGLAVVADFRRHGMPRARRLLVSASFVLPVLGTASLSHALLAGRHGTVLHVALAVAAGLLLVAAVEDMLAEAHEAGCDSRRSILSFVGGFVLFTLVSAGLSP